MRSSTVAASLLAAFPVSISAYCIDYFTPVTVNSAENQNVIALGDDLSTISGVESLLSSGVGALGQVLGGLLTTSGTFQIATTYCPPHTIANATLQAQRAKEVQFLLHGVPYNKDYWFGLKQTELSPEAGAPYSWVDYAVSQGYPVVAIDNLGAGLSSKPDPVQMVQQNLQTEIIHQMALGLTSNVGLNVTGFYNEQPTNLPPFEKIIFVGHSLGSVVGNAVAARFPADFSAMILTGFSYTLLDAAISILLAILAPASLQNPELYGDQNEALPPGYLTYTSLPGKNNAYYDAPGTFDPSLAEYDFDHEDTVTLGQILTAFNGMEAAQDYYGHVHVMTGQNDALFCGPTGSRALGNQTCGSGPDSILAKTASFFPKGDYSYFAIPETAHAVNLHYSVNETLEEAHAYLASKGY